MTTTNRIPAATLSLLMARAWKGARKAAKVSGQPVRSHTGAAMKEAWAAFRFKIESDRRRARIEAAELASAPAIPAIVTDAASDKQRAYAESVAPRMAVEVAKAFMTFREGLDQAEQRAIVDATAARFAGAKASFWLDASPGFLGEVVNVLCCRHAGIEISPDFATAIRLADLVTLS